MVNAIVAHKQNSSANLTSIEPEAHYNHYGDRGIADLYIVTETIDGEKEGKAFEVKSDSAVQEATGANEIIRQYNRMRRYFFQDEQRTVPDYCCFELCFVVSEKTVKHVCENFNTYLATDNTQLNPLMDEGGSITESVLFRLPDSDEYRPAPLPNSEKYDIRSPSDWKGFFDGGGDLSEAGDKIMQILDELGYSASMQLSHEEGAVDLPEELSPDQTQTSQTQGLLPPDSIACLEMVNYRNTILQTAHSPKMMSGRA
jgi:hypothetical protein